MKKVFALSSATLALAIAASAPSHAANVLLTDIASIAVSGTPGVLRSGSIWAPAPAPAPVATLFDGAFVAPNTTWTSGTFWWDELAFAPTAGNNLEIVVQLTGARTLSRFVVQADDNDKYAIDWWDGSAWQVAYTAPEVFTYGMETRDSGLLSPVTTDRLRVRAFAGDEYYSLSEVQAYAPEPATLLLAATGLAGVGWRVRRQAR